MWTEINTIKDSGLILEILDKEKNGRRVWLPKEEWSENPSDWKEALNRLEPKEYIDVVLIREGEGPNTYDIVSRRSFSFDEFSTGKTIGCDRILEITEVSTKKYVVGTIGNIKARVYIDEYDNRMNEIFNKNILYDHAFLGKGDFIGGCVSSLNSSSSVPIHLKASDYLDVYNKSVERLYLKETKYNQEVAFINKKEDFSNWDFPLELKQKIGLVWIIEDDEKCQKLMKSIFEKNGIKVIAESNYNRALDKVINDKDYLNFNTNKSNNGHLFLAIIDVNLENSYDHKGLEIASGISNLPNCLILIITGETTSEKKIEKYGELKVNGYLAKPFTTNQLIDSINQTIFNDPTPLKHLIDYDESNLLPFSDEDEVINNYKTISIKSLLQQLTVMKAGTTIHVFRLRHRSLRPESIENIGDAFNWFPFRDKVVKSPIKDAAFNQEMVVETNASSKIQKPDKSPSSHYWTSKMMEYESFLGLKLKIKDHHHYVLVAFHKERDAFNYQFRNKALSIAEQISRFIENDLLLRARREESIFASTGLALTMLSHELHTSLFVPEGALTIILDKMNNSASLNEEKTQEIKELCLNLKHDLSSIIEKATILTGVRRPETKVSVMKTLYYAIKGVKSVVSSTFPNPKNFKIVLPSENSTENWYVNTAPAALVIVFFNIYFNAVQQMHLIKSLRKRGVVWHTCEYHVDENNKPWVIVRICDTGPGIHKSDWEHIFQPGFTTKEDGSGLGLYICRYLLNSIQEPPNRIANIEVTRSVIWAGTTFTIRLPLIEQGEHRCKT